MFKTVYTAHEEHVCFSNPGEKDRPNYRPEYSSNGVYELVEDGVFHSYDDIQAWLPTCDLAQIMERYIRTGDESILQRRAGYYADVTGLPTNYAELHNTLRHADEVFSSLPVEIREKFNQNPAEFFSSSHTGEILAAYFNKAQQDSPVVQQPKAEKGDDISE